jgi:hypothetical protein
MARPNSVVTKVSSNKMGIIKANSMAAVPFVRDLISMGSSRKIPH